MEFLELLKAHTLLWQVIFTGDLSCIPKEMFFGMPEYYQEALEEKKIYFKNMTFDGHTIDPFISIYNEEVLSILIHSTNQKYLKESKKYFGKVTTTFPIIDDEKGIIADQIKEYKYFYPNFEIPMVIKIKMQSGIPDTYMIVIDIPLDKDLGPIPRNINWKKAKIDILERSSTGMRYNIIPNKSLYSKREMKKHPEYFKEGGKAIRF
ncbi:hypothetical protein QQ008_28890 [Fulvivirgaceae bacterium BMA10]|uniref:Uncharacterized protein n=1 Tax=Splendidivirga corallicola TaxID=3051826 RepID=A0ABT8KXE7_9BACT|nr:hypothetical protein [Fulvivirgaceae bacterium BMA10]